jgi:hypothetical protein
VGVARSVVILGRHVWRMVGDRVPTGTPEGTQEERERNGDEPAPLVPFRYGRVAYCTGAEDTSETNAIFGD